MDEEKKSETPKAVKIDFKGFKIPKLKSNKIAAVFGGLITLVIIIGILVTFFNISYGRGISGNAAEEKAENYLTGNFLAAQGMSAEAISHSDEGNYYAINVNILQGESVRDSAIVYVSKDGGSLFVGQTYDLTGSPSAITGATTQEPSITVPKSDKPEVELFIMSYCPYGLQMQKGFLPVIDLFGDKIDASVKWVHYVMHGEEEATENTRQYCIQQEQNDKYIAYAECFVVDGDIDGCVDKVGIDKNKLANCMGKTTADFKIEQNLASDERFPRYLVTGDESQAYGVQGSPTLIINGEMVQISRDSESIKNAICAAFNTPPSECEQTLSSETPSPGLGGGTGDASAGYCG